MAVVDKDAAGSAATALATLVMAISSAAATAGADLAGAALITASLAWASDCTEERQESAVVFWPGWAEKLAVVWLARARSRRGSSGFGKTDVLDESEVGVPLSCGKKSKRWTNWCEEEPMGKGDTKTLV